MSGPEPAITDAGPSRLLKVGVVAFLLWFVWVGWSGFEEWPFTGWRLYSLPRGPTITEYRPYAVGPDGVERSIDFSSFPIAYYHGKILVRRFARYSQSQRDALCDAIAEGERGEGRAVSAIRIYRVEDTLRERGGRQVKDTQRELRYTCANDGGDT